VRLTALLVSNFWKETRPEFPALASVLARKMGQTPRSVRVHLCRLTDLAWLTRTRPKQGCKYAYRLTFPKSVEAGGTGRVGGRNSYPQLPGTVEAEGTRLRKLRVPDSYAQLPVTPKTPQESGGVGQGGRALEGRTRQLDSEGNPAEADAPLSLAERCACGNPKPARWSACRDCRRRELDLPAVASLGGIGSQHP